VAISAPICTAGAGFALDSEPFSGHIAIKRMIMHARARTLSLALERIETTPFVFLIRAAHHPFAPWDRNHL
jgi:hypothetical protein